MTDRTRLDFETTKKFMFGARMSVSEKRPLEKVMAHRADEYYFVPQDFTELQLRTFGCVHWDEDYILLAPWIVQFLEDGYELMDMRGDPGEDEPKVELGEEIKDEQGNVIGHEAKVTLPESRKRVVGQDNLNIAQEAQIRGVSRYGVRLDSLPGNEEKPIQFQYAEVTAEDEAELEETNPNQAMQNKLLKKLEEITGQKIDGISFE